MTLTVNQGNTVTLDVAVTTAAGAPVDLTGSTLRFAVRRSPSDPIILDKTSSGGGITIAPGTGGTATVSIVAADTEAGPTGIFAWELEGTDPAGKVTTLASGTFVITATLV